MLTLSDYHFDLPQELIAKYPAKQRSGSRLLHLQRRTGQVHDRQFIDLKEFIQPNDLLVFNDTRVIPARLFAHKSTGGQVEILIERLLDEKNAWAHIRASKALKPGMTIWFAEQPLLTVIEKRDSLYHLQSRQLSILKLLDSYGQIPLPPYMEREPEQEDAERYQTVFARENGSVAAPTAGLHFDDAILAELAAKQISFAYVTLHVGAGTFQPVRHEDITQHQIHQEWLTVSPEVCEQVRLTKAKGGRVIGVGTTSVRSLETAAKQGSLQPFKGETSLFIYPGYEFKVIDAMLTNFHLPKSSLLMLVSAFAGFDTIKHTYAHAVQQQYRFFSYGDAMFIE